MNYIQRAKIAQKILAAARGIDVTAVTLYGYEDRLTIQTYGPIDGYDYAPRIEGGHPRHEFEVDGVVVDLVYVEPEEVAA